MIGEALAMVMGNTRVWSAGIYFDQNQFPNRTYFAPYAYKTQLNTRRFQVGSDISFWISKFYFSTAHPYLWHCPTSCTSWCL